MKKLDPAFWSPFWRNPTITSFGNLFPANYDGVMLEFWKRHVTADVQDVLDVACGNGALCWIASDITRELGVATRITGVDWAAIDPFAALGRRPEDFPRVRFVGDTPAEKLPAGDGTVDLVVSQYGIEYADFDRAIPEVGRVLRGAGRMAFIMHDRESVIVKGATEHLDDFKGALDHIRLHELCMAFDQLLRSTKNMQRLAGSTAFREIDGRIVEAQYRLRVMLRRHPPSSPLAAYSGALNQALQMRAARDADGRRRLIEQAAARLREHVERVQDLWLAALAPEGREHLVQLVRRQGFTISEMDVLRYKDGDNFGTLFAAARGQAHA